MEENTTANVEKAGRMTAKEQILEIYPTAYVRAEGPLYRVPIRTRWAVIAYTEDSKRIAFLGRISYSEEEAWKSAWNQIQLQLLESFEK